MKDIIVLEINSKKDVLGQIEIDTPNEFLLITNTESILNNRIFEDFIDDMFFLTINELSQEFEEKIDNVYITFIDNDDVFICSVVIDRLNPKKSTYRMKVVDWQSTRQIFKYMSNEEME